MVSTLGLVTLSSWVLSSLLIRLLRLTWLRACSLTMDGVRGSVFLPGLPVDSCCGCQSLKSCLKPTLSSQPPIARAPLSFPWDSLGLLAFCPRCSSVWMLEPCRIIWGSFREKNDVGQAAGFSVNVEDWLGGWCHWGQEEVLDEMVSWMETQAKSRAKKAWHLLNSELRPKGKTYFLFNELY